MEQIVVRGRGCLNGETLPALMARLGVTRPLLVCSSRMQADFSARTGLSFPLFSAYHANPDLADCAAGAEIYREQNCDAIVSVGGGSAMDTAKAVKALLLAGNMESVMNSRLPEGRLPHIAIPATAGTGAEATPIAVVYVGGKKLSLDHPALLPEAILLDASLLETLPVYHKKACALDALCQGIESFWAARATAESRIHAERAIRGMLGNFNAYLAGDGAAAEAMLEAAYASGCAIRISRTTAAHAMSYQITKRLGYAHGHACMLTLPYLWRRMGDSPVVQELSRIVGAADVPSLLLGLLAETGMLPDVQPDDDALDALASSVNPERLGNHPEKLTTAELRAVYAQAFTPILAEEKERLAAMWRQYAG